ncbi:hypothetical protein E4U55_005089 [Claviceps digitariae]|nr:hypothetical protein E4U55_005089 [Claviceps digitariae]
MDDSGNPLDAAQEQSPISQSTQVTSASAESRPSTNGDDARQEELVPELRILEVMRSFRSEKESHVMEPLEPSPEAQEHQEPNLIALQPQGDSGAEASQGISSPSDKVVSSNGHESPEAESAIMPASSGPRLKKSRKRAYQKLEEEAEEILKGWTPTGNAGVSTRGNLEKPSQKKPGDVKASKIFKSNGKRGRPPKAPRVSGERLGPSAIAKTSQAKVSASKVSRRGRPRGRVMVAGGALGTKRATNAAPLSKEPQVASKQDKTRSSTSVHAGRVTKPASRGGRGRGRPRKSLS